MPERTNPNPYRNRRLRELPDGMERAFEPQEGRVERLSEPGGPGLLGADLEQIARHHYAAGFADAEDKCRNRQRELFGRFEEIFDDGYDEGDAAHQVRLAQEFAYRLLAVDAALRYVESGPKARMVERLKLLRAEVASAGELAAQIMGEQNRIRQAVEAASPVDPESA